MQIIIKFNHKLSKWYVFLNHSLFLTYTLSKLKKTFFSLIFKGYFILLRILRQFGIVKPLRNTKYF